MIIQGQILITLVLHNRQQANPALPLRYLRLFVQPNIYNTFQEICTRQVPYIQHTLLTAFNPLVGGSGSCHDASCRNHRDKRFYRQPEGQHTHTWNECMPTHRRTHSWTPCSPKYNSTNKTQSWLCCSTVKCIMITTTSVHKKLCTKATKQ